MEESRRRFLKTLVAGVVGGDLILKATPEEVLAFGVQPGHQVVAIPPMQMWRNFPDYNLLPAFQKVGTILYNDRGQAVATVTKFAASHPDWEDNPWQQPADGIPHPEKIQIFLEAAGLPELLR